MAHAAEIIDGIVTRVLVIPDEQEHRIQEYLTDDLGFGGIWIQTSYNANLRFNFAGVGFSYDPIDDAFIPPTPCDHDSLTLNDLKRWECSSCDDDIKQRMASVEE